ncbi:MAG TPA: hypothetical protein VNA65_01200 [Candidatus Dormibacteraeota bacterium]|nr:hypothetical protein [Candidatus Dormibacteraeota bacterium]
MKTYVIALLVVVGVMAGFYGGFKVGQNNVSASAKTTSGTSGRLNSGGGFAGGGRNFGSACPSPGAPTPAAGTNAVARGSITDLSSTSMTITTQSCDVKVVFGNTVQVSKTVAGSTGDLKNNLVVTIIGTRQADGSIKATTIQIGNAAAIVGGGGGQAPNGG